MRPEAVANFISNSKPTQRLLQGVNGNPAVYTAASAFVFASVMRPTIIGALPFKEKKDKQYSQASAVSAGLIDFLVTTAIFIPLNKSIDKASAQLTAGVFKYSRVVNQFKSLTNRGLKLLSFVPMSIARLAIIRPLVDTMFGKEKSDSILSKNGGKLA